jgi:hypothetical protein
MHGHIVYHRIDTTMLDLKNAAAWLLVFLPRQPPGGAATHLSKCRQDPPSRLEVLPGCCYDVEGTLANAAAVEHLQDDVWVRNQAIDVCTADSKFEFDESADPAWRFMRQLRLVRHQRTLLCTFRASTLSSPAVCVLSLLAEIRSAARHR